MAKEWGCDSEQSSLIATATAGAHSVTDKPWAKKGKSEGMRLGLERDRVANHWANFPITFQTVNLKASGMGTVADDDDGVSLGGAAALANPGTSCSKTKGKNCWSSPVQTCEWPPNTRDRIREFPIPDVRDDGSRLFDSPPCREGPVLVIIRQFAIVLFVHPAVDNNLPRFPIHSTDVD